MNVNISGTPCLDLMFQWKFSRWESQNNSSILFWNKISSHQSNYESASSASEKEEAKWELFTIQEKELAGGDKISWTRIKITMQMMKMVIIRIATMMMFMMGIRNPNGMWKAELLNWNWIWQDILGAFVHAPFRKCNREKLDGLLWWWW